MAYTSKQLTMAWTAVHTGVTPDATILADIQNKAAQNAAGALTDAQALSWVLNSADNSTALAALSYQFFTGKSPTKDGMAFLVNSPTNPNDLNDPYYTRFNLENRYINFAANLGVVGEGAAAFATKYGAMSFADYIASIYESIIGKTYAQAAGIDPAAAIAYLVSRQDAILATAKSAGMITPGMSQAQIDLAVKAAAAGFLMGEAIKADVGLYAAAANNFMLALARGDAVYNVDLTTAYKPTAGQGTGQNVTAAPSTDTMPGYVAPPPPPPPPPPPQAASFTLTAGANTFSGTNLADSFAATGATLDASDILNGGGGNDTLTVTVTTSPYTLPNPTVSSIETVTVNATGAVTANTTTWTGVTQLNISNSQATTVTAAATTNISVTNSNQGASALTVNGGADASVTTTATTGVVNIGQTTPAAGAVVVNRTSDDVAPGAVNIKGGVSVEVNLTATNAVNTTQAATAVNITTTSATTSIKVKGPQTVMADATTAGSVAGSYTFNDVNVGSSVTLGTLKTVDVDGYSTLTVGSTGLTALKLAHGDGAVTINNAGTPTGKATTLDLTLNGVTAGTVTDSGGYTHLNVASGATDSSLGLAFGAVTTLNFNGTGAGKATITDVSGMTSLTSVTASGAARFSVDVSGLNTVTTVDTTGSTGAGSVTIDPSKTTFTGGAGADTVTLSGTNITQAINLGGGNDTLVLANLTGVPGVVLNGGAGTADVLSMLFTDAIALSGSNAFANQVTGFERLLIRGGGITTLDVTQLGNYHYFISQQGLGIILKGLVSGDTLEFKGLGTATRLDPGDFGGANDTLNIVLANPGATVMYGRLFGDVIENLVISIDDTAATKGTHAWRAMSTSVKTVTVTGNADISLTLDSTNVTSVDASGLTGGGLGYTTGALTGAATIKGSANHDNGVNFSAATQAVTYVGGSGADVVTAGHGANLINVGTGADRVNVTNANFNSDTVFTTITGLSAGDELYISPQLGPSEMTGALGAAITIGGTPSFADYLNAAAVGDGSTTSIMKWFQFGGDTYVVLDSHQDAVFTIDYDIVVKLTGAINLNGAAVNNGVLTL